MKFTVNINLPNTIEFGGKATYYTAKKSCLKAIKLGKTGAKKIVGSHPVPNGALVIGLAIPYMAASGIVVIVCSTGAGLLGVLGGLGLDIINIGFASLDCIEWTQNKITKLRQKKPAKPVDPKTLIKAIQNISVQNEFHQQPESSPAVHITTKYDLSYTSEHELEQHFANLNLNTDKTEVIELELVETTNTTNKIS